jgi:hypothetical protein
MFHTAQSNNGHSARTSGSVCWQQYRAKTICLSPSHGIVCQLLQLALTQTR